MNVKLILALSILPLVSILVYLQFISFVVATTHYLTITETIPMLSIVVVNIFIFVLVENIMRQNEKNKALLLIETQNDAQQKRIGQLMDYHEQVRHIFHNFKQQADVLYRLCKEKQYDELLDNLSKLSNHHNTLIIVKTGNLLLDTILSSKKAEATKQNIDFEFLLNVKPNLSYINMEICILLGNAIDNAIEACMRSTLDIKIIEMNLTATQSSFLFKMRNSIGETPQVEGEFLKTKKSDSLHHGIGMSSMSQTCRKLGGNLDYEYDDEQFRIWIHLPIE